MCFYLHKEDIKDIGGQLPVLANLKARWALWQLQVTFIFAMEMRQRRGKRGKEEEGSVKGGSSVIKKKKDF